MAVDIDDCIGRSLRIRKEIRKVIPLYRNSESGLCVPFACREIASSNSDDEQVEEKSVGPAGPNIGVIEPTISNS